MKITYCAKLSNLSTHKLKKVDNAIVEKAIDGDICCFDAEDNFISLASELKCSNHEICLDEVLAPQAVSLSFGDKVALLQQQSMVCENDLLNISWEDLCLPQMVSVAKFLDVRISPVQIQCSPNPANISKNR